MTELKTLSIRKNQLQDKIDGVKAQYASLLTDMQDLQSKLADGQKALQQLSHDYMKAVNQTPAPADLAARMGEPEQIPMAVESFVHSLGISLTEEQKSQLDGLLQRPNQDPDDRSAGKRMALYHLHQDIVGNTLSQATLQGWNFPLPEDDSWSCDGTEESIRGNQFELKTNFEDEPHSPAALSQTG